jgi:uncharacterized protein (TIGR02391 family)
MGVEPFSAIALDRISRITGEKLTGTGITQILNDSNVPQPEPVGATKWRRIFAALDNEQRNSGSGACVIRFIQDASKPQRWPERVVFDKLRDGLNQALIYNGLTVHADGKVGKTTTATTHDEAAKATAKRLRNEMSRRNGHAQVFKYCSEELVAEDCFNAVFEATKGLAERVRDLVNLDLDGYALVDAALMGKEPMMVLNAYRTETERNEQVGVANLMKGCFSAFRNPLAHEPKVSWHVPEADALDLLSTLSLIHRRLDNAHILRRVE